ncbi:alpha/beta hydrolase [Trichococcus sp. K1Tr]|uniref:alpha/beta fold hydrolase n=1 Tax=Trichococcus sp. K1Tr TaxID=3020847 RepID=UPI00232A9B08|nr:alpha/beta hydrolase [Trichococcus sp. K1Tr]MDB6353536.1 alpha/beta hydrolase [Trichococcus sp. K1Tr]
MELIAKSAELTNGLRLSYAEQGANSGTPLILLPGIADSWRIFEPLLAELTESVHVYALSQRGHGDSDRPKSGYRTRDFVEDLRLFMDALQIGEAVIVGASSGGFAARSFAATHPERTAGLVLLGSPATLTGRPNLFAELKDPIDPGFMKSFAESVLSRAASAEALDSMIAENLKVPARVWVETSNGLLEETLPGELAKIQAPTLIVWGDRDPIITNEDQLALTEVIKGSKLIAHSGSGHMLYWEEPALIARDIVDFLINGKI